MFEYWYAFVDFILPFEWTGHLFMKNALLGVILVTPLFGILGTMVVNNHMAFFSDSLGHGAFTGIALGAVFGGVMPVWAAAFFSIIFAITITMVKNKGKNSTDTVIGVFSSIAVALGLAILSFGGNFNKFSSYLAGDLLSIRSEEIILIFFVFAIVIILWLTIFNKLLIISINQSLAASRGINTLIPEMLFTCSIAVVVTVTMQWVGLLLINSLLVLPAAAARNVTSNIRQYHIISVAISSFSGIIGLIFSYYMNIASGAAIVLVSAILFFGTCVIRKRLVGS